MPGSQNCSKALGLYVPLQGTDLTDNSFDRVECTARRGCGRHYVFATLPIPTLTVVGLISYSSFFLQDIIFCQSSGKVDLRKGLATGTSFLSSSERFAPPRDILLEEPDVYNPGEYQRVSHTLTLPPCHHISP